MHHIELLNWKERHKDVTMLRIVGPNAKEGYTYLLEMAIHNTRLAKKMYVWQTLTSVEITRVLNSMYDELAKQCYNNYRNM